MQPGSSFPSWERGLKSEPWPAKLPLKASFPSWERGLKSGTDETGVHRHGVVPLVGTWIEIDYHQKKT